VGEIVNVSADESILDENGKVDAAKLRPITYDPMNHHYLVLGQQVGQAFHDGLTLK
jgi:flavin reductase (DIM6/NTAB) family NADH-FMN oxidoreductase RutF